MLAEALEHLVRGVVEHPDDVSVRDKQLRRGSILEVRVHPTDLGKVIGRGGRTATAFRTVISARSPVVAARGSTSWTLTEGAELAAPSTMGIAPSGTVPIGISAGRMSPDVNAEDYVVVGRIGRRTGCAAR